MFSLTFPAAFGVAPLSSNSSATSTLPYLEATCNEVKPFYRITKRSVGTIDQLLFWTMVTKFNIHFSRSVVPWSSWSAAPACPGGCEQFEHDLPGQRCAEVCVQLWWWSWGWLCAPVEASPAPYDPSEQHNAAGFGRPVAPSIMKHNRHPQYICF